MKDLSRMKRKELEAISKKELNGMKKEELINLIELLTEKKPIGNAKLGAFKDIRTRDKFTYILHRRGLSNEEIRDTLRNKRGISVTKESISRFIWRGSNIAERDKGRRSIGKFKSVKERNGYIKERCKKNIKTEIIYEELKEKYDLYLSQWFLYNIIMQAEEEIIQERWKKEEIKREIKKLKQLNLDKQRKKLAKRISKFYDSYYPVIDARKKLVNLIDEFVNDFNKSLVFFDTDKKYIELSKRKKFISFLCDGRTISIAKNSKDGVLMVNKWGGTCTSNDNKCNERINEIINDFIFSEYADALKKKHNFYKAMANLSFFVNGNKRVQLKVNDFVSQKTYDSIKNQSIKNSVVLSLEYREENI